MSINKNEQFDLMKGHMKYTIEHMHYDNVGDCFSLLTAQYEVLKQLGVIESLKLEVGITDVQAMSTEVLAETLTVDIPKEPTIIKLQPEPEVKVVDANRPMYLVERKLVGAYVEEIEGFIPESIFRGEGLAHGDYVYATPIDSQESGQKRFEYSLAKKTYGENPADRVEYLYCPVEKDGSMLITRKSSATGDRIRHGDSPYSALLSDSDIERFNLVDGDLVDVAFYASNPGSVRVFWKHRVHDNFVMDVAEHTPNALRNSKHSSKELTVEQVYFEQVFKGQTICIVGDKPNEASYKQIIEDRGGELLHVDPKWIPSRIEHSVRNSNVVIGLYDVSSHTGLEKAKEYCKQYNVPYEMISGRGKSKTIQTAIDLLGVMV